MLDGDDPCEEIVFNDFSGDDDHDYDADYEFESMYPTMFKSDEIDISADYDWHCYHIITNKYHVCWYLGSETFSVLERSTKRTYDVHLKGNLDRFFECQMVENDYGNMVVDKVLSADHNSVVKFEELVDRIWNLKAFS